MHRRRDGSSVLTDDDDCHVTVREREFSDLPPRVNIYSGFNHKFCRKVYAL